MRDVMLGLLLAATITADALGQTPQPFPRPGGNAAQQPEVSAPTSAPRPATAPATPPPVVQSPAATPGSAGPADEPSSATLGFPIYPTARFIASYDAGRGQRYYLFGATAPYADLVAFYRAQLKDKGDEVFNQPPTHVFEVGRFRAESMAFPPGVTVKDWTWGGSQGYPNPKLGAEPARYPSVIMIVPAPPAAPAPSR